MTRKLPSTAKDYLDTLSRRKWWLIYSVVGISTLVFVISLLLPKEYRSETLILVEPQKIPVEYVRATVTTDATDRLQTISEEMMSRTRLSNIITKFDLYPKLRKTKSLDEVVAVMRKSITVDVLTDNHPEKQGVGAFKLSFTGPTPQIACEVTQELANQFIKENLKVRDQQAEGTEHFISDQVLQARKQLEAQEEKIRQFNAAHLGALPEQEQTNLQLVSQYQSLEQTNSEAIDRATQQRAYLQSMLSISGAKEKSAPVTFSPTQLELQKKKQELAAAKQKYTDSYPDVVALKSDVSALEQQVKSEPPAPKAEPSGLAAPDQVQQFQGQLVSINEEIKTRSSRESELEGQIRGLQGRIAILPEVQSQFADLNRDYQAMQKNYQSLVEKESASGMASELEHRDDSEQFRILDPANLPDKPASPNLILINGAGILGSIIIGLLLALFTEVRDATLHDSADVERYLSIPVISAIPRIPGSEDVAARRLKQLPVNVS
jgi:polysaccharide chain length determinant protein (PEP-CTERM system associated)